MTEGQEEVEESREGTEYKTSSQADSHGATSYDDDAGDEVGGSRRGCLDKKKTEEISAAAPPWKAYKI
ncbi:hypothetical protein ACLKA6_010922 [Drosophila palustris]